MPSVTNTNSNSEPLYANSMATHYLFLPSQWQNRISVYDIMNCNTNFSLYAINIYMHLVITYLFCFFRTAKLYHGYCRDEKKNAAVIFLRYTMLRHNGLIWEVIHISPFDIMWRNPWIWSWKKSCRWPCIFRIIIQSHVFRRCCSKSSSLC